jgi:DNA-binding HxlR family transcriptional regulator
VGEPWSFLILQEAFFGVRRFDDFHRNLGIARNTLTDRLARLITYDLLERCAYQTRPPRDEYRLTRRGLDTYPYALCLMRWGDEWLAGAEGPPVTLYHKTCRKTLHPLALCSACQREIRTEDVSINPGSARGPALQPGAPVRYSSRPELYTAGRKTSVSRTLAVIGDRWGFFVLWLALAGITKFEHFHRILGIARTILSARLERLSAHGLLERRLYRERPPRHEYYLTPQGQTLCPVLLTLFDWGQRWLGSDAVPTSVLHKACGEPLSVRVVCTHCREVAQAQDVQVVPSPSAVTRSVHRHRTKRSPSSAVESPTHGESKRLRLTSHSRLRSEAP